MKQIKDESTRTNFPQNKAAYFNFKLVIFILPLILMTLQLDLGKRLRFPSGSDQDSYLEAGKEFVEQAVFLWRAPLYSAWMGLFYFMSGEASQLCFFFEKYFSVFLFSLLVAYLGQKLFDLRTGLLMGVWVLNCKYFIIEANGSHAMVGALFTASVLCLLLQNKHTRLPFALFFLFLATQVRIEMWGVFLFVVVAVSIITFRGDYRRTIKWAQLKSGGVYWLSCLTVGIGLTILFASRPSFVEPPIPNHAFVQNFAVNYVERKGLLDRYPQPWAAVTRVWEDALPGATDALSAIRMYPNEIGAHFLYNLKLSLKALPANIFAVDNPLLMLVVMVVYFGTHVFWMKPADYLEKWRSIPADTFSLLAIFSIALCLVIPMTMIYRAAARYYIPLIPVQLVITMFAIRVAMSRAALFAKASIQSHG